MQFVKESLYLPACFLYGILSEIAEDLIQAELVNMSIKSKHIRPSIIEIYTHFF